MTLTEGFIANKISGLAESSPGYWGFHKRAKRDYCHGLMTYPAMMVPEMQGELIDILLEASPDIRSIFDPFVGSGTVLGEALFRGVEFTGTDVNPLAILCCESKSEYFDDGYLVGITAKLETEIPTISDYSIVEFAGSRKWFEERALRALSKIRHLITSEPQRWCRKFLWVALVETIRKYSNTRTSTYKLHRKAIISDADENEIYEHFLRKVRKNTALKKKLWDELSRKGLLVDSRPQAAITVDVCDVRQLPNNLTADMIVTSPPYGDNATTVTYGQYSYLPLNFIDLNDIDSNFDRAIVNSQSAIDSASLGGSLRDISPKFDELRLKSRSVSKIVSELKSLGLGGEKRFIAFTYDLMLSLVRISASLNDGGYAMLTLGNRKINKVEIPLDSIVRELLESQGLSRVTEFNRKIPVKRMPGTMSSEFILIMRKDSAVI